MSAVQTVSPGGEEPSHLPTKAGEEQHPACSAASSASTVNIFQLLLLLQSPKNRQCRGSLRGTASAHLPGSLTSCPLYHYHVATGQEPTNHRELHPLNVWHLYKQKGFCKSKEAETRSFSTLRPAILFSGLAIKYIVAVQSVIPQNHTKESGRTFSLLFSL